MGIGKIELNIFHIQGLPWFPACFGVSPVNPCVWDHVHWRIRGFLHIYYSKRPTFPHISPGPDLVVYREKKECSHEEEFRAATLKNFFFSTCTSSSIRKKKKKKRKKRTTVFKFYFWKTTTNKQGLSSLSGITSSTKVTVEVVTFSSTCSCIVPWFWQHMVSYQKWSFSLVNK